MSTRPLLLEIGTEELPSSFVDAALAALPELVRARLADLRLTHGEVQALGSPRRLSVLVHGVAEKQADLDEEVLGPPEAHAFKDGKPTKAAEAFAAKLGVDVGALTVADKPAEGKQKAGRYLVGRRAEKGTLAKELVAKALVDVCEKIPFKKSMRWGDLDATFGRPVQWIVALFGADVVDLVFAGVRSGRATRGHRFLSPKPFDLAGADQYVAAMREHHVLVDRAERERTMMERVAAAAKALGGTHDDAAILVSENASLVEEPFVVEGGFEPAFLSLPASVIRAVARGHQRYFCVAKGEDELLPSYLAVVNTANSPANIRKGMDRVMRARLADARFFYEEDKKAKIADRLEKTAGIVFHARLGTVREKVTRMEVLAGAISDALGFPASERQLVVRAAHLCKFDLVSLMVGEFPELQGQMGRAYALHAGEHASVADAVRDHYRPVGATDDLPASDVSRIVALADRIDTLTGCFAIGLSPTGAADPFALRRACIAVLRILCEVGAVDPRYAALDLGDLVARAYANILPKKLDLDAPTTSAKVLDFARERLRGIIAQATSQAVADAVLAGPDPVGRPAYALLRARGLAAAVEAKSPWLQTAKTVAKRLAGISKTAKPMLHPIDVFATSDADRAKNAPIVSLVELVDEATGDLTSKERVAAALEVIPKVADGLEEVFVKTLVNDPADPLTPKRLELLSYGASCMLRLADFGRLLGGA